MFLIPNNISKKGMKMMIEKFINKIGYFYTPQKNGNEMTPPEIWTKKP